METIIAQKVTPLIKCLALLLFIFTAKVLTSRPIEKQETKNVIMHDFKSLPYVRSFTKYHHRRTINYDVDLTEDHKIRHRNKRELKDDFQNSNSNQQVKDNGHIVAKNPMVKPEILLSDTTTTLSPRISCYYKIHSVSLSVTPSYKDIENNLQQENDYFDVPGPLSDTTLDSGETVQIEHCTDSQASCYTLYQQLDDTDDGNVTVLGQGCWRSSQKGGVDGCDKCTRVTPKLPATKFCCCTTSFCNSNFLSLEEYIPPPIAESTAENRSSVQNYSQIVSASLLGLVAFVMLGFIIRTLYCNRVVLEKQEISSAENGEIGDSTGARDVLATGLLCVDNLTLIEHIGQGKYGSVWRGRLGDMSVAVKLYSSIMYWRRESSLYESGELIHPNLLKYYGSDLRRGITESESSRLIVMELCKTTLRTRLMENTVTWAEFAELAHGIASALAHLHTQGLKKQCIVHRDVNSNNVLVMSDGTPKLADLSLAQEVYSKPNPATPRRIPEAGTLRYLAPEALEGALDLAGARAALCAVDVYALGLVLWEILSRAPCYGGNVPPYSLPYAALGLVHPSLGEMQNLVSRNKLRPEIPKGPASDPRALKIAADTCEECWDHDAEARLTAVCVEERMAELKQILNSQSPLIRDNNLHPNTDMGTHSPPDTDKNSNCFTIQNCDIHTPLLYSHPNIGRNTCIERNTHADPHTNTVQLIQKSIKDINIPNEDIKVMPRQQNIDENIISVARSSNVITNLYENSDRFNEIKVCQRPLDFVSNDVNSIEIDNRLPKQTNINNEIKVEKPKWSIKNFFERKLLKNTKPLETEVTLLPDNLSNGNIGIKTSVVNEKLANIIIDTHRPSNLVISPDIHYFEGPCTLSPPNRTLSPTMLMESQMNKSENKIFGFRELPTRDENNSKNQIFAVIVPKITANDYREHIIEMHKAPGSSDSINKSAKTSASSHSLYKSGTSESEDSTFKKRLSCDNKIITNISNSGRSSRASINLELQYINNEQNSAFEMNSDCSSSEDEHLMLLSENDGSKITMKTITKNEVVEPNKKHHADVLKEYKSTEFIFGNKLNNKYKAFDNELSDPMDKENIVNGFSGDNPVYLASLNGDIGTPKIEIDGGPKSPKPNLKSLAIIRQHSLEQIGDIFSSSGDIHLQNPAGRVKTPGDLPVAIRNARRDRAMQKGRGNEANRLSLYDDRMMFGNTL